MNKISVISCGIISIFFIVVSCNKDSDVKKEPWIDQPVAQWPDFALTNKIRFIDTTYTDLANSFLVDTGKDTVGVSCKHIFMVFASHQGLSSIDLGKNFIDWKIYPKNKPDHGVLIKRLINRDSNEPIGQFNTLKDRDWIIFDLQEKRNDIYPLKIRFAPVRKNEVVYAVGWGIKKPKSDYPAVAKLQCYKQMGNYFYVDVLQSDGHPEGTSGSPVIDQNGYLVGIVSGAEGKLGVIGSVEYLKGLFDKYGIEYRIDS